MVERGAWHKFKRKFCIVESYVYKGHLRYSWENKEFHRHIPTVQNAPLIGDYVLKRLDRVYAVVTTRCCNFHLSSAILPGFCFSNYAIVVATIKAYGQAHRSLLCRINIRDLKNEVLQDKLEAMWGSFFAKVLLDNSLACKALFKGLYQRKRLTCTHGKLKAKMKRRKENALQQTLAKAQLELEDPQSIVT